MKIVVEKGIVLKFITYLILSLGLGYVIQFYVFETIFSINNDLWSMLCYLTNAVLATLVFIGLLKYGEKQIDNLGYVFLVGSLLKFMVYLIVFRPFFNKDGATTKLEFLSFFIPYAIALVVEIYFITKVLNAIPVDKTKYLVIEEDAEDVSEEE